MTIKDSINAKALQYARAGRVEESGKINGDDFGGIAALGSVEKDTKK